MNNAGKWAIFIMLLIFCTIFGFVGGSTYFEDLHGAEIARTGTETTGYIEEAWGWADEDSIPEWGYLQFYYYDKETNAKHYGETNTSFSYSEIMQLLDDGEFKIKYNEKYEAVAADYKYSHNFGTMAAFFYIALVGGLATLGFGVSIIVSSRKVSKVKKEGTPALATFVAKSCNVYVNGNPRYRITYKYNASEEGGGERTVKSKELFNMQDAVYYEAQKQFEIRYMGKLSVITEKPYSKSYNKSQTESISSSSDGACDEHKNCDFDENEQGTTYSTFADISTKDSGEKNILCEHCAAHLSPKDKRCPNCGEKVRKK